MTLRVSTYTLREPKTEEQIFNELGPLAKRFGRFPKGTVLPATQTPACPRVRVRDLPAGHLKQNWIEALEHDQQISSCCRHPENHEVEALRSHPDEGAPDVYVFHCGCGRQHRFFCVGRTDKRPAWEAD